MQRLIILGAVCAFATACTTMEDRAVERLQREHSAEYAAFWDASNELREATGTRMANLNFSEILEMDNPRRDPGFRGIIEDEPEKVAA